LLCNNNNDSAKSKMTPLPARDAYNSYSDAIARNCFGRQCRHSTVKRSIATVSADNSVVAVNVGPSCVAGLTEFSHSVYRSTVAYGVYMVW